MASLGGHILRIGGKYLIAKYLNSFSKNSVNVFGEIPSKVSEFFCKFFLNDEKIKYLRNVARKTAIRI